MRRKHFAVAAYTIALLLAVTSLDISFVSAETIGITGVSAASPEFRTIQLTWDAVIIEQTEPETPEPETNEPAALETEAAEPEAADFEADFDDATVSGESEELAGESEVDGLDPTEPEIIYEPITYKVYRATSKNGKYKLVTTTEETQYTNTGLKAGKTYYYRIYAYNSAGEKVAQSAKVKAKVKKQKAASLTLITKGDSFFDYREEAGEKLYKYDTLQGACANDGHAYLTLYNRKVEKCKIVKVDLSTLSVEKVSAPLPIYHGNCLTFNTNKNVLVATCCQVKDKRAVLVDPETLTVVSKKDIKLTSSVKNLPTSVRKRYKGFTAITYNEANDIYIGRLRDNNNVIIFDGNLKPKKYVKLRGKKSYLLNQGMDSVGNYIFDVRSFKGKHKYSMVTIHTLKGTFVGQIKFPYGKKPGNELQCIFHDGEQFYAGFYRSTSQNNDTQANHVKRDNKLYTLNNL